MVRTGWSSARAAAPRREESMGPTLAPMCGGREPCTGSRAARRTARAGPPVCVTATAGPSLVSLLERDGHAAGEHRVVQLDGGRDGVRRDVEDDDAPDGVARVDLAEERIRAVEVERSGAVGRVLPTLGVDQRLVVAEERLRPVTDVRHRDVDEDVLALRLLVQELVTDLRDTGLDLRHGKLEHAVADRLADARQVRRRIGLLG